MMEAKVQLQRIDDYRWRIDRRQRPDMRVDGIVYANDTLIDQVRNDQSLVQVANVATLPGIVGQSLAMPDIHFGYGFCIGGVAATDPEQGGVISPGGVGYDINCGVRLIRSDLTEPQVAPKIEKLVHKLFSAVPCGVGREGEIQFEPKELRRLMARGSEYVLEKGLGWSSDLEATESNGRLKDPDPDAVSPRALAAAGHSVAHWARETTSSRCR